MVKRPAHTITCSCKAKHCNHTSELSTSLSRRKQEPTMIIARRIAQLAKKWQRMATLGRKRVSWGVPEEEDQCCTSATGKGHCVVYTADGTRLELPLAYLSTPVFTELLRMSQEEFGFVSGGRITLPCDVTVMEYAMCLLRRRASAEVEKAFLSTMAMSCRYASYVVPHVGVSHQVAVCSF